MIKKQKQSNRVMKVTILFCYGLFILTATGSIVSVAIPLARILGDSVVHRERIIVLLISMALVTVLLPFISYIVGVRATHSQSKIERHYNGSLFGIVSVWLLLVLSMIRPSIPNISFIPLQVVQFWPQVTVTFLILAIGVAYAKSHKQQVALLSYKPYQAILLLAIGGMILLNVWYFVSYIATHLSSLNFSSWEVIAVITIPVQLGMLAISYRLTRLTQSAWSDRLSGASISASIGIIATMVIGQLMIMYATIDTLTIVLLMNFAGVFTWLVYMRLIYAKR